MAITYRTTGPWGAGKGANLSPTDVDGNFYDLSGRLTYIEDNPVLPVVPIAMGIEGASFTMALSNGDSLGPIAITYPIPDWRGDWTPATGYEEMDFIVAPDGGLGAVMRDHTSAATFEWSAINADGDALYQKLLGGTGETTALGDLLDVSLSGLAAGDFFIYGGGLWQNRTPTYVVGLLPLFGGDTGSGGTRGIVPAPAAGDAAAGKVLAASGSWVVPETSSGGGSSSLAGLSDVAISSPANNNLLQYSSTDGLWHNRTLASLGAGTLTLIETSGGVSGGPITATGMLSLSPVDPRNLLANLGSAPASPGGTSLSTFLDAAAGANRGALLRRDATGWSVLNPGTDGQFLRTSGSGADVAWGNPAGSGTVTSVATSGGIVGGPITGTGTLSLATIADGTVLANVSGSPAAPASTSVTLLLDLALGSTQGQILYRGATQWAALAPGASGQLLRSNGAAADPSWSSGAGAGTVTSVATSGGIVGGPITSTGTVSLATIADGTVLANISGATAVPVAASLSAVTDATFGSVRGSVLYRGASGWAALVPGSAGDVLTTGGAGANPAWAPGSGGASITISDTAPTVVDGALWWDSVSGQLFIGYDDGNSIQWVIAVNSAGPAGATGPAGPAGATVTAGTGLTLAGTVMSLTTPALPLAGGTMTGRLFSTGPSAGVDLAPIDGSGANYIVFAYSDKVAFYRAATGDVLNVSTSAFTIATGNAVKPGGGSWAAPSDRSLKSSVVGWSTGLDAVLALEPVAYRYNDEAWNGEQDHIGLDAEDASAVIPEMGRTITVGKDATEAGALDHTPLLFALVNAVRELAARVEELEARLPYGPEVLPA